jgi:hypothetical protein
MRKNVFRATLAVVLVAVVAVSAAALLAGSRRLEEPDQTEPEGTYRVLPEKPFQQCPSPPCMAPCQYGVPPEVLCKAANGSVQATTYTCCCCGSSGASYKPLN